MNEIELYSWIPKSSFFLVFVSGEYMFLMQPALPNNATREGLSKNAMTTIQPILPVAKVTVMCKPDS